MDRPDRQIVRGSKGVILITDDNPNNIRILYNMLEEEGYTVRATLNGKQALESIRAEKPDLLLLDINIPEMNGYEVCRQLKASHETNHFPIIFISALDSALDKVTAFSCGGVDYITKPFQINEVIARVETHLNLSRLQMQLEKLVADRTEELQKTLRELEIAHKRLDLLNRTKSDFLSMISHEMRTPLNGILGLTDLVIDDCVDKDMMTEIKSMYAQAKTRILNLLSDSLQLDRLSVQDGDVVCSRIAAEHLVSFLRGDHEFPEMVIEDEETNQGLKERYLCIDEILLTKSLHTLAQMSRLSSGDEGVQIRVRCDKDHLVFLFPLRQCQESASNLDQVFRLSSSTRNRTQFDAMGLSPVIAFKTLSLFEGALKISQSEQGRYPEISVSLPLEPIREDNAQQ